MPPTIKIVLFEDTTQTRSEILTALKNRLLPEDSLIPFEGGQPTESDEDKERMYEDRLERILSNAPYDGATLVVADHDLSKSQEYAFGGLSVNSVAAACRRLAIPVCSYSRRPELENDYIRRGLWEEGHIVLRLSEGEDELARKATIIARGFAELTAKLAEVNVKSKRSPAKLLADILEKPEYSDKIALYTIGDQNRLPETGVLVETEQAQGWMKRVSHFLGYWLWDSLLRYPGLFVNEVAAASHLNIEPNSFQRPEVRTIFEAALYRGPFADVKPQWWRGMLDDIVSGEGYADGLELVRSSVDREINYCPCYVETSKPAGYYCVISHQPVSLENSKGGLSWFPRGADLTRISNPVFEEYEPWLGA
jgi:hypothetical protein